MTYWHISARATVARQIGGAARAREARAARAAVGQRSGSHAHAAKCNQRCRGKKNRSPLASALNPSQFRRPRRSRRRLAGSADDRDSHSSNLVRRTIEVA